jgi:tetratricopeptide (TPR) repeat protein
MRTTHLSGVALLVLSALASAGDAMAAYKGADYKRAIPLLQAAVATAPKDPAIRAALLSALVFDGRVEEASEAADADTAEFPQSPEIMAARGEFALYMSDTAEAEKLFKHAIQLKDDNSRAVFGLYRLYRAASMYRSARLLCLRAHAIDPEDALITLAYIRYLVPEKRAELLQPLMSSHPWLARTLEKDEESRSEVRNELNGRKVFELDGQPREVTLPLVYLNDNPKRVRGVALQVSVNGGHPLKLLLDTGASGILLSQAAIDRLGLKHLGSFETRGIGDKGGRASFVSIADTCSIGTLNYKTCLFGAVSGKRVSGYEDGLIGADVFSDYLVQIDCQTRQLHLTPLAF